MEVLNGKTSIGVYNNFKEEIIAKKTKFSHKQLMGLDYSTVNPNKWTTDKDKSDIIHQIINNYNIKYKELLGKYTTCEICCYSWR